MRGDGRVRGIREVEGEVLVHEPHTLNEPLWKHGLKKEELQRRGPLG